MGNSGSRTRKKDAAVEGGESEWHLKWKGNERGGKVREMGGKANEKDGGQSG